MLVCKFNRFLLLFFLFLVTGSFCLAQSFPQQKINEALSKQYSGSAILQQTSVHETRQGHGVMSLMKDMPGKFKMIRERLASGNFSSMLDTVFVGDVPNDTLIITGNYFNNGPLLVFNDGVLIFQNANATILGDIYVFQNGTLSCDSSMLSFPQQYFYQRSLVIADNGQVSISNTILDYGGLSHNLAVAGNGSIVMNEIINMGFTTAGAYGNAEITINGSNQAGEFIMTDSSELNFEDVNTLLLWHHLPDGSLVDVAFPSGANVASYQFNENQPGVSGVGFTVTVTSSTDVMWALMPENGSDVTISNATLRAVGLWFTGSDSVTVSGLVNNSNYSAFTAPLSDRVLQLNNTSVQTWSLYLFDQVVMNVTGCIVGEVGSMGTSNITAQGILCDGSGGYYWASDTSLNINVSGTVTGYIRSQGNGIVLLGYGAATAGASAIGNSVMVVTQSSLPQDPVAFDAGTAWLVRITPPQNLFVDTLVDVSGSAWIDQGPLGSFMDFGNYTLSYAPSAVPGWIPISMPSSVEVDNDLLGQWDTHGLTPGNYNLRLNTVNNLGDSIDAILQVTLLPSVLSDEFNTNGNLDFRAYYDREQNEIVISGTLEKSGASQVKVLGINGNLISESALSLQESDAIRIPFSPPTPGSYFVHLQTPHASGIRAFIVSY